MYCRRVTAVPHPQALVTRASSDLPRLHTLSLTRLHIAFLSGNEHTSRSNAERIVFDARFAGGTVSPSAVRVLLAAFPFARMIGLEYFGFQVFQVPNPSWHPVSRAGHLTELRLVNSHYLRDLLGILDESVAHGRLLALTSLSLGRLTSRDVQLLRKLLLRLGPQLMHLGLQWNYWRSRSDDREYRLSATPLSPR